MGCTPQQESSGVIASLQAWALSVEKGRVSGESTCSLSKANYWVLFFSHHFVFYVVRLADAEAAAAAAEAKKEYDIALAKMQDPWRISFMRLKRSNDIGKDRAVLLEGD